VARRPGAASFWDVENTVIKERSGTPIYVKNVATVQVGTGYRRNIYEKDGDDVVGGVLVMRQGENPLAVTERVKKKIQELQPGLPPGVRIIPAYDRTRLIHGAIDHLTGIKWQPPSVLYAVVLAGLALLITLSRVRGRSAALALPQGNKEDYHEEVCGGARKEGTGSTNATSATKPRPGTTSRALVGARCISWGRPGSVASYHHSGLLGMVQPGA
jgi:hypothetical protein